MEFPTPPDELVDRLADAATVETVYGDPVTADGKTVVPVARVAYGFGIEPDGADGEKEGGAGLGGGVSVSPVGALEVTDDDTRFVRFESGRRLAGVFAAGALAGYLLDRRERGGDGA